MRGPAERFPVSRACQAQGYLAAILNRCFALSPIDALITTLKQTAPYEGAQDASAQIGLRLGPGSLVDSIGWVEDDARRCGLGIGIGINFTCCHLKHAINHANMEVHMLVQARSNRWMKATVPMCSAALSTCAAPGQCWCRLCTMTRKKMRSTMLRTAPSRCMK